MLKAAAAFAVITLILGVLAFGGLVSVAWSMTKLLFWIALVIAAALTVLGLIARRKLS